MKIVIFSYHYLCSQNKAGFHFIANELAHMGHEVIFVSTPYSVINYTKFTAKGGKLSELNKRIPIKNNLSSVVLFSVLPLISYRSRLIDKILEPLLVWQYKLLINTTLKIYIQHADIILFESNQFLRMFDFIYKQNPHAKYVYRVSDLMWCIPKFPQWAIQYEKKIIDKFNVVSVPSSYMFEYYKTHIQDKAKLQLDYHGIDKEIFNNNNDLSPYDINKINLVWVGISQFDIEFIKIVAKLYPTFIFHIIGIQELINLPNVINYGVMQFKDTIKYIKYATVGLACHKYTQGGESYSNSLKVMQYSYCDLPIIAPQFMHHYAGNNMFFYEPNNEESIKTCLDSAISIKLEHFNYTILDWENTTKKIFAQVLK